MIGDRPDQLLIDARRGLLDALEALEEHFDHLVLVGAQAIYLHTNDLVTGVALRTKDADLALIPPLATTPDVAEAMQAAGFVRGPQPGVWLNEGRQVDLLVPDVLADPRGRRAARLPGHGDNAARKVAGIEGAAVDRELRTIGSLDSSDPRQFPLLVAGPGALLVSKLIKLAEREAELRQGRLYAKDAHDAYRLLRMPTKGLAERMVIVQRSEVSAHAAELGLAALASLFATPNSVGSELAGEYVAGVGNPGEVQLAASVLANDLLQELRARAERAGDATGHLMYRSEPTTRE